MTVYAPCEWQLGLTREVHFARTAASGAVTMADAAASEHYRPESPRAEFSGGAFGFPGFPAGHFYSPLLDLQSVKPGESQMPFGGEEWWEHIDLRATDLLR